MERPRGVAETTWLMCFFNLSAYPFIDWDDADLPVFMAASFTVLVIASYWVLWFYWRGRNWARWLVLATSLLELWNVTLLPSSTSLEAVILGAEAILGGFLLYWLNTAPVRQWFARDKQRVIPNE
jgi:hypothetical protein